MSTDMTQLDPASGFKRGSTLEAGGGGHYKQQSSLFFSPSPVYVRAFHGRDYSHRGLE